MSFPPSNRHNRILEKKQLTPNDHQSHIKTIEFSVEPVWALRRKVYNSFIDFIIGNVPSDNITMLEKRLGRSFGKAFKMLIYLSSEEFDHKRK